MVHVWAGFQYVWQSFTSICEVWFTHIKPGVCFCDCSLLTVWYDRNIYCYWGISSNSFSKYLLQGIEELNNSSHWTAWNDFICWFSTCFSSWWHGRLLLYPAIMCTDKWLHCLWQMWKKDSERKWCKCSLFLATEVLCLSVFHSLCIRWPLRFCDLILNQSYSVLSLQTTSQRSQTVFSSYQKGVNQKLCYQNTNRPHPLKIGL